MDLMKALTSQYMKQELPEVQVGDTVRAGSDADIKPGNALALADIPVGTVIHNIELYPGKGGQLVRSAGNMAQLMAKEGNYAQLRLPSGEVRMIPLKARATIGTVGNTSLTEAALYAVPWSAIEKIRNDGRPVGEVLFRLRSNVEKPIAAILTLNTVANTAGSAVAGAAFMAAFGAEYMALFAAGFTVLILAFGEIVPKTLGVAYATSIAVVLARPLEVAVKLLTPVIWLTGLLTRLLTPPSNGPDISEDDIRAVTSLSRQAGQIKAYEEAYIRNILALDQKRVYDIMTPRTVVFSLPEDMTAAEYAGE